VYTIDTKWAGESSQIDVEDNMKLAGIQMTSSSETLEAEGRARNGGGNYYVYVKCTALGGEIKIVGVKSC
jgi:hypothetical protein